MPRWFTQKDNLYPKDKYISAIGEGSSQQEAQDNAISQISLYFDTTTEASRKLVNAYNETKIKQFYQSIEHKTISETATIKSAAQFFCVQFSSVFKAGNVFYVLAFIDKVVAYKTYSENIRVNTIILKSLVSIVDGYDDPFYRVPAIKKGIAISNITLQMLKNIQIFGVDSLDDSGGDFAEVTSLIEKLQVAQKDILGTVAFSVNVSGDWNGTVSKTICEIVERSGFAVSVADSTSFVSSDNSIDNTNNSSSFNNANSFNNSSNSSNSVNCIGKIVAMIDPNVEINSAGLFLTCALVINLFKSDGNIVFSYTRKFDRIGAPEKYKDVAYRKSFALIEDDLRQSFSNEFNSKMNGE